MYFSASEKLLKLNMKNIFLVIAILLTVLSYGKCNQTSDTTVIISKIAGWKVVVNDKGSIINLQMTFKKKLVNIPWRNDANGGPAWKGIQLSKVTGNKVVFEGKQNDQLYTIEYKDVQGKLAIIASLKNESAQPLMANPAIGLRLGIDNEMKDPKKYFNTFFPTLLRCERTHFWGYFQSPDGQILTVSSPDAIASRTIEYIEQGHRISTSSLDVLHTLPLPSRHPQNLIQLAPGQSKSWTIYLEPVNALTDVMQTVANNCKAPFIDISQTTVAPGEKINFKINASNTNSTISILDPNGKNIAIHKKVVSGKAIQYTLTAPATIGNYTIVTKANNKQSEAVFHVRKPWGWYLQQARTEALRMQIKPMSHREGWLGFFSAYGAERYYPNAKLLAETEAIFKDFYTIMVDTAKTEFYRNKQTWHDRPQNTSWMLALVVSRYAATKKMEDLELAAKWGDAFIAKFQKENGSFSKYSALTLGTKFLAELAIHEKPLAATSAFWKDKYDRHMLSIEKASKKLLEVKDLEDTEGEATYEDTQAGSAWTLLALQAMMTDNEALKIEYLNASIQIQSRHESITQALIPDARMRNATLRFWESQYDVLTLPNFINSPHGWTMRSQFGALYLYLLTGQEKYLDILNNAMGASVQAIDERSGILRWAFVPDPYIAAQQFVPDNANPGKGKNIDVVLGEQWLPMISDWWRVPKGEIGTLTQFKTKGFQVVSQGWSCDNDVHETFRILADELIPNAFVLEREDGTLRTMNCTIEKKGKTLFVKMNENVITRLHLNLKNNFTVVTTFANKTTTQKVTKGSSWVGPGGVPTLFNEK
jgi:hypothetical protein